SDTFIVRCPCAAPGGPFPPARARPPGDHDSSCQFVPPRARKRQSVPTRGRRVRAAFAVRPSGTPGFLKSNPAGGGFLCRPRAGRLGSEEDAMPLDYEALCRTWDPWSFIPADYNLGVALTRGQVERGRGDRPALLWENASGQARALSYR